MKILIMDNAAGGLDFAWRCKNAGHEVKYFFTYKVGPNQSIVPTIGDGLVDKVTDYKKWSKWADLIVVTDNLKFMKEIEELRNQGLPVFGIDDELSASELDRNYGQDIFKKYGIKTMPYEGPFNSYDEGIAFVKKNPDTRWVSKPCGNEEDKALSYVSKSAVDMISMLEMWKKKGKKQSFILQEFKPGIEMAVGGFFGPAGFSKYFVENFEFKKYMNKDLGINTGEQGTVISYTKNSKLADTVLKPLIPYLKQVNYCGYVDVACIIDEKTGVPYPLEFTSRFGYPLWYIQQALHVGDPAQWMLDLINGKDTLKVKDEKIATGIVLTNGSFPQKPTPYGEEQDYPIGLDKVNMNDIHFSDVKMGDVIKNENGKIKKAKGFVTAGNYVLITTGVGNSVKDSADKAYKVIENVELGNSPQYRTDIGERLKEQLPKLHKLGYAPHIRYEGKGSRLAEEYAKILTRKTRFR
jgi:phosphoribosylamine--glycine ligase